MLKWFLEESVYQAPFDGHHATILMKSNELFSKNCHKLNLAFIFVCGFGFAFIIISLHHLNAEEVADAGKESYGDDNYHHLGASVFFFFRQCLLHIFTLSPLGKKPS